MNTRNTTAARIFRRLKREADFTLRAILSAAILTLPATGLRADTPVGTVVSGEASFDYNGNKTTITAGNNAIIEYPKFNIDRNETVQFVQPTDTSRVLNRITGGDPSSILGSLQANGIVYFVNPAGIYFGQHATIDVGQFYAAAGNLSNANFLAGRDNFERLSGQVHNEGTINASAIHLIGQNVRNTGNLNAPAGLVMLAAGDDVLIGRRGEHVFVNATKTTPDAASATAGVENAGNINAEGGRALLAAGDLYALAVQNSGVIKARNVELAGQGSGEVWNRGAIDAASADTEGGRVEITGQYIGIDENAIIDASGAHGGGEVLIGGDYQGANAGIRNATATYVAEGAAIRADATTSGSGGKVIVWADETTRFHGSISATGFTSGGFAEVSGKQNLLYTGLADLRSADGSAGTLLLDPDNLTISTAASTPGVIPGSVFTAPVSDTDWNLNTSDLVTQLELANVTVQTLTGNITVADAIAWTNPYSLTLNSGSDILINSPITADAGDLILLAARDTILSGAGAVNVGGIFSATSRFFESASLENTITAGGDISIATPQATGNVSIGGTMISNAGDINISTIGLSICAPLITNSGDGDITLGSGAHGGTTISEAGLINSGGKFTANGSTFTTSSATNTITAGGDIYIRAFYVLTGYIHIGGTVTSTGGGITTESYSETVISAPLIADIGGTNGVSVAVACGSLTVGDVTSGGAQTYTISGDQGRYIAAATITGTGLLKTTSAAAGNITISSGSGSSFLTDGGRIESARNFTVTVDTADFSTAAANTITAGGDISITATAGNITLAGNLTAGTAGSGAITLTSTNGNLSLAGITATSNGDQTYSAGGSLILPSVINTGTGGILANTSGDLTLESIISGKSFSFTGSNIYVTNTLATTNAADGDITLKATGTITLVDGSTTDGLINAAGAFSATSASFLSENAANTITTGGAISITSPNVSLKGNVSSTTGGITVKAGAFFRSTGTIFSDISGTHGVSINEDLVGGGRISELGDVISGGSQTYYAADTIDIKGLLKTYDAETGDIMIESDSRISLNNSGEIDSAGKITVSSNDVFVTQTAANTISAMGDIDISGASIALGGGLTADTGNITLSAIHSPLSSDSDITAGGNITIDGRSGITLNGALTSSTGAIAINNIEGAITLGNAITAATDISIATTYNGSITLGNAITAGNDISIATTYDITVNGNLTSGTAGSGAITLTSTNGDLSLSGITATSNGDQSYSAGGSLILPSVINTGTGGVSAATTGDLTLESIISGKSFSFSGSNIYVTNTLATTNAADGDITLKATGTITLVDGPTTDGLINAAGAFSATSGVFISENTANTITTGGAISITSPNVSLKGNVSSATGGITVKAGSSFRSTGTIFSDISGTHGVSIDGGFGGWGYLELGDVISGGSQTYNAGGTIDIKGLLKTYNAGTGDITIENNSEILLNNLGSIASAGKITVRADGEFVTQTAANTISAMGDIAISGASIALGGGLTAVTGSITLLSIHSSLSFDSDITAGGNITIDGRSGITLNGALTSSTGAIAINNLEGAITLGNAITAATDISISTTYNGSITLGNAITAGNDISITIYNGSIGIAGDITSTAGDITLNAKYGDILVTADGRIDAAAQFTATAATFTATAAANTITSGGDIDITTAGVVGNIILNGDLTSTAGAISLNAVSGDITSNALISATNSTVTTNAGAIGSITLGDVLSGGAQSHSTANYFTGTGHLKAGGDITIAANHNITLDGDITAAAGGGSGGITLTSTIGDIALSGITATSNGDQAYSAGGSLILPSVINTGTGGVSAATTGDLTLESITSGKSFSFSGSNIYVTNTLATTNADDGDITLLATGTITLVHNVTTDGLINAAAKFTSTSASFVSQDAANTITAAKGIAITSTASTGGIMFAGDLLSNAGDITLASSGSIVSTAGITADGSFSATASSNIILVNVTSGGSQDYTSTAGSITHTGTISTVGATFRAPGGLTLDRLISGSNVSLTAGFITLNDLLQTTSASAGDITLDATNGKILVTGDGRIDAASVFSATSRVDGFTTETVANTITAGTGINITTGGAAGLVLNGDLESTAGNITLVSSGSLVSTAAITAAAGALTATSGSDMTLGDVTTDGAQTYTYYNIFTATSGTLKTTGAGSDIALKQLVKIPGTDEYSGDILIKDVSAAGAFSATSGRFTLLGGGTIAAIGDISISNPVPSGYTYVTAWYTNVHGTIDSSAGSVSIISGRGGLNISGTIASFGAQYYESWRTVARGTFITSDTDTGDITFNYNGSWGAPAISFETTTIVDAARDIKLHYPPNAGAHSGTITLPAGAVFNANNAIIIDTAAVSFVSLLADLNSGAGGINVNASGTLILGNATTTGTQSFAAGNITLTGTLGGSGDLVLASTTGSIALTGEDALIDMGGDITVTAATTFTTAAAVNTITAGTNIAITANDDITINGNLTAASAGDAGAITLTSNAGDISLLKVTATSNGDQTYTAAGSILLTDILDAGAGSITANAGGDLTLPTITADNALSFTGSNIYITGTLETTNAADGGITLVGTGSTIMVHTATTNGLIDAAGAFTSTSAAFVSNSAANTINAGGSVKIEATTDDVVLNGALTSGNTIMIVSQTGITSGSLATITADGSITMRNANAHIILYGDMESASGGINLQSRAQVFLRGDVKSGVTGTDGIRVESSIASIETKNVLTGGAQTYVIKGSDRWYFKANGALTSLDAATGDITIIARPSEGVTFSGSSKVNAAGKFTSTMGGAFTTVGAANTITAGGLITISSTSIALNGAVFNDAGILLTANNGSITTTAQITATTGNVIMNAGAGSITANAGILSGGTQSYTAGSLTASGQLRTTSAATGDIVISTTGATLLTGDNQIDAARSFTANARELTTASAANTIAAAADITITTTDDITINGNLTAASTGDAGAITLTSSAGDISLIKVTATSNGDQTYTAAGSILLTDILDAGAGSITATAGGDLTLPTITAGNDLRFTAGNNIHVVGTLATTNAAAGITLAAAGTTTLVHTATTNGLVDAAGKFTSTSAAFLSETAANTITTVGDITITATSNAGIAIYGDILSTAGSLLTDSYGNTTVNASVTTSGSQIYETMHGTGGITITGTLATTNASDGDIRLLSHNTATLSGDALINADGAVYVDALTLVTAGSANTITAGKWISVHATTATGDAVTLNGALTAINDNIQIVTAGGNITANATLTADTSAVELDAGSNGNITVGNVLTGGTQAYAGGSFTGTGLLKTTYANDGDIVINTTGATLLTGDYGLINAAGAFTSTSASFRSETAANTITTVGDIAITATSNAGIAINGDILSTAGSLLTDSYGNTTVNAGVTTSGSQVYETMHGTGGITITGTLETTNASDGDIRLLSHNTATLSGDALINADGAVYVDALTLVTAGSANTITAGKWISVHATAATGDAVTLNGALTAINDNIQIVTAGGNITANATLTADTSAVELDAGSNGNITVGNVLTGGTQAYAGGSFTGTGLLKTTYANDGDIVINTTGATLITGDDGRIDSAAQLTAAADSFTTSSTTNTITTVGDITIATLTDIALNGNLDTSAALTLTSTAGNIALTDINALSNGDQTHTAAGSILLSNTLNAGSGGITATAGGALTVVNATGSSAIALTGSQITLTGLLATANASDGAITLNATDAGITLADSGAINSADTLSATANGTFLSTAAANTITAAGNIGITIAQDGLGAKGDILLNGALTSTAGGITLNAHERNITATAQITADTTGAGGITAYAGWGDITLAGVLTGGAQNYFSAGFTGTGHLQTTNATHGNINIDARGILITEAGGQITAANSLNATASLGGFTTSSTANTITAGNAITIATANDIQLHGAATAVNDIKLTSTTGDILSTARLTSSAAGLAATANNGDITLGNAQTSGTQIYAATTLTGTGLLKTTDAATGDIVINTTGATLITGDDGAVDSARDINITADTLTTAAVANTLDAARDIAITTTDDITINGNLTAASTGGPGAITLTSAAGDISLIKVTATSNGDQTYTAAGSILLTDILDAGAGSITANAGGDLTLATIIADNALSFTGSNITITGTLETTNAIGGDITLVGTGSTIMVHTDTTNGLINAAAAFTSTSAVFVSNSAANTINAGGPVKIEATSDDVVLNGALTSGSTIMIVSQTGITSGSLATIIAAGSIVMSNPLGHIILNGDMESASGGINLWSNNDVLLRGDVKSGVTGTDGIRVESSVASIETKNVLTGGAQTYVINGSESRHFNATGTLTSLDAATGDITIITPPSENTTFTESGNVNAAGKFTHTGGMFLTEGAANTINAGGLISISATSIALNGAVFNDTDIHLTADGGAIATTAQITATTGNVIMNAGAGDITTAGVLSGGTQSYAGGSFTGTGLLKTTNTATGDIVIATTGATLITGDDGAVDSARDINMAADTLTTAAAANTLAAGRNITLAANNDITIQGDITAAANAGHGAITMTSTAGNIALLHITATSNGDQAYTAALDITLTDLINTGSGSLLADAGGLLTLHSVITGGTLALTGSSLLVTGTLRTTNPARGSIALTATGADITFTDAGSIISADTFTGTAKGNFLATTVSNTLAVASTLSIAAEAGMELHGALNAGNAITLASDGGDILSTAQITSANAGLAATANNGAITIGNVTTSSAQTYTSLTLTGTGLLKTTNASTGDILINVTDTVLLTGQGAINSAGVITGTVGAITADGAANTLTAAKNINLTAANDISLAGDLASATGNILVNTTDGGSVTLTNHLSTPSGEIKLTTTGTGAITLHNATSSGDQTHATEGGNINVTGTLAIGSGATMRFSTTSATDTGTTVIDAGAALVVPNTTLLVQGGMFLDENGRISAPVGIDIQGAGAGVTFNAALGGAGNPLATINIAGAGAIDINGGIETTGAQTYNTDGGDINITSLLRATDNGAAITFDTHNPSGTTGMTTVHTGGIQTNNTTVTSTGGLTLAADTTFDAGGGSLYIDGQGRAASLGIDLELPQINILNAGDIHLSGVTTTGDQYYHFDDGAAMRLTGTLLATGNGSSITIENTRTDHAEWATIFAVGGNGIHIETLNGDITISKYNTLLSYDPDNGAASPTAGDIYIRAWNGLATVPDISASHQVDLIALAITLNGTLYQSGGINILGMDGAPINSGLFTIDEPSVNIVAIKSRSLYPPLVGINSYAYLPSLYDEVTLRVTTDFFNTDTPPPAGSIFNEIYSSDFRSWMYLYTELVQVNIAANTFDKSLELSAVEENMRKATAGYLASNDAANRITGATKEHLYNVGIFARGATDAERLSQHHHRGLFQQIIPSEIPSPEHRKVVDGRISETSARETVALYQETFMTIDDDGRPVSRTSEILAALTATYNAYRATTATPGPVGFGLYIDDNAATNTDAAVSQKFVRSLRTLFAAIERIGLTRTEVAVAKSVLLRPLRSPAIPGATLRGLIEPDTILASAPPAGAPKITANF
ncbi:filamentous hemagglutinin family protein [Ereboglobus sp. PH5-10]|uniref:filamentous hemagglutinin N-terminal domain-containing protein n=1 Tax=Ereboglobus sp. PH5-10 TaxID=2940629 RepID=UPI002405EC16|nr:filamentous hemagglutinin N-terminal domain-containing protein [Ereboglobus sp. PH5-10]MDF9826547.1 filamentous hemagglutinin family protein [Ereboglobus sp. PH5-10]